VLCVDVTPDDACAVSTKSATTGINATPSTSAIAPPRNFPASSSAMFFGFTSLVFSFRF